MITSIPASRFHTSCISFKAGVCNSYQYSHWYKTKLQTQVVCTAIVSSRLYQIQIAKSGFIPLRNHKVVQIKTIMFKNYFGAGVKKHISGFL